MKKLYRKGTVHPSLPLVTDHLSYLPAAILTLAVALSPEDREVLDYLISSSSSSSTNHHRKGRSTTAGSNINNNSCVSINSSTASAGSQSARRSSKDDHPACFSCYCFRCYMSYWVRWDSSPNRQLIHEILDAFEDGPVQKKTKKEKRRKNKGSVKSSEEGAKMVIKNGSEIVLLDRDRTPDKELDELGQSAKEGWEVDGGDSSGGGAMVEDEEGEEEEEKGTSVRRFVGFLGEKIWGIWN